MLVHEQVLERDTGRMQGSFVGPWKSAAAGGHFQTLEMSNLEPFDCCHDSAQGKHRGTQEITTNLCPWEEAVNFSVSLGFRLKEDLCTEIILDIVAALQLYFLRGKYFAYILNSTWSVSLIPIGLIRFY